MKLRKRQFKGVSAGDFVYNLLASAGLTSCNKCS